MSAEVGPGAYFVELMQPSITSGERQSSAYKEETLPPPPPIPHYLPLWNSIAWDTLHP